MPPTEQDPATALVRAVEALCEAPSYAASLHMVGHLRELIEDVAAHDLLALAEGRTQAEIAEVLEVSPQAVSQRLDRARKRLDRRAGRFTFAVQEPTGGVAIKRSGGGS